MKELALILFVFAALTAQAQRNVEKEVAYKDQPVEVDLAFASEIEMKTWNRKLIKIEATVQTEDEKYTEMYQLEINASDSKITIGSNTKEIFEAHRKANSGWNNDLEHEFNYTLFIPEGVKLELSSVTGSVTSQFLEGDIKIDLVTGDINIEKFKGDLDLKSVTGKIDLPVKDSSYSAKTVMGSIHGNQDPQAERKSKFVGEEVNRDFEGSQNRLTLNTVTGDIYLK